MKRSTRVWLTKIIKSVDPQNKIILNMHCAEPVLEQGKMLGITTIEFGDFLIDRCVGEGSFSHVFKVKLYEQGNLRSRLLENKAMKPEDDENPSFALKYPRTKDLSQKEAEQCSVDLMNEANILSTLDHKNIIQIKGVSTDPEMILLELLETTLEDRLRYWRREKSDHKTQRRRGGPPLRRSASSLLPSFSSHSRQARQMDFFKRTESLVNGIASGMAYLHSRKIILRDLKPENIGFDARGEVKIFDFGLACHANDEGAYQVAGSLRYMAPETIRRAAQGLEGQDMTTSTKQAPSFAVDIYSFGLILWEIAALKKPFSALLGQNPAHENNGRGGVEAAASVMLDKVANEGWRPSTKGIPSKGYSNLIGECWHQFEGARPCFDNILLRLSTIYSTSSSSDSSAPKDRERRQQQEGQDAGSVSTSSTTRPPLRFLHQGVRRIRRSISLGGSVEASEVNKNKRWQDRIRPYRHCRTTSARDDETGMKNQQGVGAGARPRRTFHQDSTETTRENSTMQEDDAKLECRSCIEDDDSLFDEDSEAENDDAKLECRSCIEDDDSLFDEDFEAENGELDPNVFVI
jgi:serine/threonine protein kinase